MKKVLALFLVLNMAVGLLLVPAAAYNEEESGCRDLEWHWETDDDGNEYIKIDQSIALGKDNYYIVDHIQGHQGAFRLYQLFYLGDALPEDAELYYVPDDADDTGISVDFGYDEEFAAYAMITFNEWDSSGSIIYRDESGAEHMLSSVTCEGYAHADFYENLYDQYPIDDWHYFDEGSTLYLRCNVPDYVTLVKNSCENVRIDYDYYGTDYDIVDVSCGEDDTFGVYLALTFREQPRGNGWVRFSCERCFVGDGGWTQWLDYDIYLVNHAPRLVLIDGQWDEYGNAFTGGVTNGSSYGIPTDSLGAWGGYFALVLFEDFDENGEPIYSDWLRPEQLSWRRVDGDNEDGLDVFWNKDLLCLVPWEYGEYELSYTSDHGDTYTYTVGFVPNTALRFRSESGQPGKTVTVPVIVDSVDLTCASLGLTLWFDGATLEFISCDSDALDMSRVEVGTFDDHVNLAWSEPDNHAFAVGTELMRLTFYVKEDGYSSTVYVRGLISDKNLWNSCYDEDGNTVDLARNDFDIRVDEHIAGDLNLDGFVTTDDALCLLKWLVQRDDHGIADGMMDHLCVSGRDQVSLYDVTRLLQYVAGWNVEIYY